MSSADQAEIAFIVAVFVIFALTLVYASWQQFRLEKEQIRAKLQRKE